MNTIKIINSLFLDENGVQAKNGKGKHQTVHLRQGDLDGACAVYSTFMILIMIGAVKYDDIKVSGTEYDGRYSIERLKKELLEKKGLHREGNHFFHEDYDNIKDILTRTYSTWVSVTHEKNDIIQNIKNNIENDQPVLISITYKGGDAHALVAIGAESDANGILTKILCLDPGYPTPRFTYWNSVIDLKPMTTKNAKPYGGKYPYRNITEVGENTNIGLADILIIAKKG